MRCAPGGCYSFKWVGEKATHIAHNALKLELELPAHVLVTKAFELVDNWSDSDARVVCAPSSYKCHEFWPEGEGPNAHIVRSTKPKFFTDLSEDIYKAYKEELAVQQVGEMSDKSKLLAATKKECRQQNAEKARQARTAATAERKKRRRVQLA